ncbi:unnamed protein product [Miscanthus lutarioriparius]|uniref:Stress-response A/B barrel domain-containing protein n=1 Tax=Miscanthus lutarioriparius TaxID=422564 RepID=A0A811PAW0_9POAL|nr:unnamed protein product [Miscanthus lutarioriparius]
MSVPASAQVPQPHTIRPVGSCFRLHQLSAQNLDRYSRVPCVCVDRRWWGTGKKMILSTRGCIEDPNRENFTHAVFTRFQQKEDITKFQSSAYYSKIVDEHGSVSVDFESEVEDDIIPIFRRGEDFNYGVEFMLLISFF